MTLDLHQYAVSPSTPDFLTAYYDNRTTESQQILDELLDHHRLEPGLPSALGTWGRGSHARGCIRHNALDNLDVPPDFPFSGSTRLTFAIGKHIHGVIQTAWHLAMHPEDACTGKADCPHGVQLEAIVDNRPHGYDHSGHIDMLWRPDEDTVEAVEVKSMSDWGFRDAVGEQFFGKKIPQGPKLDAVTQAGEYALGCGADRVRIIGVNKGKHDSFAEWLIPLEEILPLVHDDLEVQQETRETVDAGMLPGRWHPEHGPIETPGEHVSRTGGKWPKPYWFCGGCRWNDLCKTLPTGPVELEEVPA